MFSDVKELLDVLYESADASTQAPVALSLYSDESVFRNESSVAFLTQYISECVCEWSDGGKHYSPYLALVNASMTGKSRLLSELHTQGVFTFISCYRPEIWAQYRPQRTAGVADWAATKPYTNLVRFTAEACTLFVACLEKLLAFLATQPDQDPDRLKGKARLVKLAGLWRAFEPSIWGDVYTQMREVGLKFSQDFTRTAGSENANEVIETRKRALTVPEGLELSEVEAKSRTATVLKHRLVQLLGAEGFPDMKQVHVVFVFDEAREIAKSGDNFHALRRAMRVLPDGRSSVNAFCVVTDSVASIASGESRVAPPTRPMPVSTRARSIGQGLFYPYVFVMGFDVWWNDAQTALLSLQSPVAVAQVARQLRNHLQPIKTQTSNLTVGSDSQAPMVGSQPFASVMTREVLEDFEVIIMLTHTEAACIC